MNIIRYGKSIDVHGYRITPVEKIISKNIIKKNMISVFTDYFPVAILISTGSEEIILDMSGNLMDKNELSLLMKNQTPDADNPISLK
ncbi:MAG: hypothetical protein OEZ58_04290 [Gammaproteobacteria bacterium]|nr:hypothetical protein [Gammaproteobacteria bacterium]MDH5728183.1 hypothetical protein [Gammaproteobacteria bacterium]